jgi:MFS family permease
MTKPVSPAAVAQPADPGGREAGLWSPRHRALTVGLVLTIALTAFEVLAVATVMPIVVGELGGLELYGWAFSAFFLGSLLGTVIVGGLLDRSGLVGSFIGSLSLFGLGLGLAGGAPSMLLLVVARFVQGLGAGALTPVANVAIARALPERLRPGMFAVLSTAWVVPSLVGPAAAGVIAESFGWRLVFFGLLPLIVIAGGLTWRAIGAIRGSDDGPLAPSPAARGGTAARGARVPLAVAATLGAGLVTAGLASGQPVAIGALVVPGAVFGAAAVGVGAILVAAAVRSLTPPGTLRLERGLPAAIALRGVLTFAFFALEAYVSLALIEWRGLAAGLAGLAIAAGSLTWTAGAWIQAHGALRRGYPFFVRVGFGTIALGTLLFALGLDLAVPIWVGFAGIAVAGLGMGMAYAPQSLIVLRESAEAEQGAATSALSLSDLLGTALGTGLTGAILAAGLRAGAGTGPSLLPAFLVGATVSTLGFALSGRLVAAGRGAGGTGLR